VISITTWLTVCFCFQYFNIIGSWALGRAPSLQQFSKVSCENFGGPLTSPSKYTVF